MKALHPEYAKGGLVFIVLSWVPVLLAGVAANPGQFVSPILRGGVVAALVVGVMRGSRWATIVLVAGSIVAQFFFAYTIPFLLMVVGVILLFWSGGSKAFRRPAQVSGVGGESPQQ